jgi:hypothetical protein
MGLIWEVDLVIFLGIFNGGLLLGVILGGFLVFDIEKACHTVSLFGSHSLYYTKTAPKITFI